MKFLFIKKYNFTYNPNYKTLYKLIEDYIIGNKSESTIAPLYFEIPLDILQQLIDYKFADPQRKPIIKDSLNIEQFLNIGNDISTRYGESNITYHGFAIPCSREDYGIIITGIRIKLESTFTPEDILYLAKLGKNASDFCLTNHIFSATFDRGEYGEYADER